MRDLCVSRITFRGLCLSFCFRQMTLYGRFSHIIFRLQLRIKPLECQSLTSFQICSPFGAGPLCLGAKQRTRISRITFRFSQITFLYEPKRSENSVKSRSLARETSPGKVMRENPPVLLLNVCIAEKSFLRMAKNILRNVNEAHWRFDNSPQFCYRLDKPAYILPYGQCV